MSLKNADSNLQGTIESMLLITILVVHALYTRTIIYIAPRSGEIYALQMLA